MTVDDPRHPFAGERVELCCFGQDNLPNSGPGNDRLGQRVFTAAFKGWPLGAAGLFRLGQHRPQP